MKESSSKGNEFQKDNDEVANNEIKSGSSVVTKDQISNPEKLFTTDSMGTGLATEITVYNDNLSLVKQITLPSTIKELRKS
jgi:hypothetical protein